MASETIADTLALIRERPTDAELYQQLGKLYFRAGEIDEAREAYERSLELDPDDPFGHLYLGNYFYANGQHQEALNCFRRGTELDPDAAIGHSLQGDAFKKLGQFDQAAEAYETAVRVEPDNVTVIRKLAEWRGYEKETLSSHGREAIRLAMHKDQAATTVALASRWLQTHPDDLTVIYDYAEMLYHMARYDEAIRVYRDAIDRFPTKRWALYNQMGHLHRYRGELAISEQWYQKAIAEDTDEAASFIFQGAVQARQGKLQQAEETHRRATQCPEGCIDEAYLNLGLVLRGQGRLSEAAASFRKALELCPKYPDALEALQDVESALRLSSDGE
ncbi:tetratricopeptide repeat protein [Limnoglobus roseus]|uniref:TPR repeat-containing protein n=1 Tax=Limnoglobus roseus TaxID=2598579 RepID=A0A5C1A765_9BACT|nr:tetratricopeptide repeat protein [Limnoglobus roseus]QEL14570.1 TPR repeat-containing protein [Limnoglobus roseus]